MKGRVLKMLKNNNQEMEMEAARWKYDLSLGTMLAWEQEKKKKKQDSSEGVTSLEVMDGYHLEQEGEWNIRWTLLRAEILVTEFISVRSERL